MASELQAMEDSTAQLHIIVMTRNWVVSQTERRLRAPFSYLRNAELQRSKDDTTTTSIIFVRKEILP